MNTNTTTQPDRVVENSTTTGGGPGTQLRQARLDLKLAPEDVAHILHLSARQIVALENDEYEKLPGPTYVRGYLRGYAQLLGLPAEQVVESYNRLVSSRKPVDLGKLAPKPEIGSDHRLIKFATAGVVALVLGLSAVWWREQEKPAPRTPVVSETTPATEEPVFGDEAPGPAASTPATPLQAPVQPPSVARNASPPPAPVPATKPPAPVATPVPTQNQSAPTAGDSQAAPPVAPDARGRVTLRTQVDSWADVRDAQGNRLLYDVVPAGRTVSLEGAMPLSVYLGNVEGLKVEFNGQAFDVSRYRRGDVARFTLGETAKTPSGETR